MAQKKQKSKKIPKSSVNGQIVSTKDLKENPRETYLQTVPPKPKQNPKPSSKNSKKK